MTPPMFKLDEVEALTGAAAVEMTCCEVSYSTDEDGNEVGTHTGWLC